MNSQPVLLFVDDEPAILSALRRTLRKEPFDVRTAPNADEALEVMASEPVVLVIADLNMPGTSGIDLLGTIADQYPGVGRILMSGNADLPSLVEAVNKGQLTYYFEKPWSDDGLRLALRELVDRIDLQKRNQELIATIRQQNEALIRQSEVQHRFFAMMSHEIRTPLNGIFGMLQVLHHQVSSAEDRRLVETALASSEHLAQIVNDVLDFSKIEAGEFELSRKPFNFAKLIEEVMAALKPLAEDKQLPLRLMGSMRSDLYLLGDDLRLRQVLINLLGNAIKFTESGHVTLRLVKCQDGRQIFEVIDTGIGIPEDKLGTLFEAYQQVTSRGTANEQGSGLGLSIARRLINLMDGDISVRSTPGEGTTFTLTLALAATDPIDSDTGLQTTNRNLQGQRYLVVDDNPTNRMIVKAMLNQVGADVLEAESGEACVSLLRHDGNFHLIFMDISMDGLDGIETLAYIRRERLVDDAVPVIAMSAHVQPEEQARFLSSGMSGFLGKPFNRESLLQLLEKFDVPAAPPPEIEPAETDDRPDVVSTEVFEALAASVGPEAMQAMVTSFDTDAAERADRITEALNSSDWQRVSSEAHALGSSAGMFGAMQLHGLCRELEDCFKQGRTDDLASLAPRLLAAITPARAEVSARSAAQT